MLLLWQLWMKQRKDLKNKSSIMSKYCKAYAIRVTYLDCLECETKECKQKGDNMVKRYLMLEPGQEVFLVFSRRLRIFINNI